MSSGATLPCEKSAPAGNRGTRKKEQNENNMEYSTEQPDAETLRTEIPGPMQAARRWLVWRSIPQAGRKPRKVPYYVDGARREATDTPADIARLVDMETAMKALERGRYAGLGFALGPDANGSCWQGIDLDGIDARPELAALAELLPGYVERSPSGKGVHAIGNGPQFDALGSNSTGIEAYSGGRYFTVTGDALGGDLENLAPFVTSTLVHRHRRTEATAPAPAAQVPVTPQQVAELRSALNAITADEYGVWVAMGHALAELGPVGRELWLTWSQASTKWRPEDARKWGTFRGDQTGYQAVFAEASRHGWVNPASREAQTLEPHAPGENPLPEALAVLAQHRPNGPRPSWDPARIKGALAYLDPINNLGMVLRALNHGSGGDLAGLDMAIEWAGAEVEPWRREAMENAWLTLDPGKKRPVTLRSLFREAKESGWDGQPWQEPPPPLSIVATTNVMRAVLPPAQYAVEPLAPRGLVTLLGAHGGAGKSMLALTLAAHMPTGRSWAGLPVVQGRALYVSLEDGAELVRHRLRRIIESYNLDPVAVASGLAILDGTEGDGALAREHGAYGVRRLVPTPVIEDLRQHAEGCALVVVDNASDAFSGDEINRQQVRSFMRLLGAIARQTGAAVMLLAHVDKHGARYGANGNTYSGSTAWHNSARSRLALAEKDGQVELVQEKLNLGRKAEPIPLTWTDDGVLVPGDNPGARVAADLVARRDAEVVRAGIQSAAAAGVDVPASRTGPHSGFRVLTTFPPIAEHFADSKPGKERFWAAIGRLQASGDLRAECYTDSHRHQRKRLICVNASMCANDNDAQGRNDAQTCARSCAGGMGDERAQSNDAQTCPHCSGEGCEWCAGEDAA
jgi:hypothetical protein